MHYNVLITGANRGLGLSLVTHYLEHENYYIFGAVQKKPGKDLIALAKEAPYRITILQMDVSSDNSVITASNAFATVSDQLDILINNAGVHYEKSYNKLEEMDFKTALKTLNINTLGPLRTAKFFLPFIKKGRKKLIINISSEAGSISQCCRKAEFDYCISKAALNMESVILQNYLKDEGVKVLSIHPGWMRTDMGGSHADIEAEAAAKGIYSVIEAHASLDDQIYYDYQGNLMQW